MAREAWAASESAQPVPPVHNWPALPRRPQPSGTCGVSIADEGQSGTIDGAPA